MPIQILPELRRRYVRKERRMSELKMDQMIAECKRKQKEDEVICFGLGTGRIAPGKRKAQKKAMEIITKQEGFIGIHPVDLWHTVLIYDTQNNAVMAKNELKCLGVPVGNVVPVLVPKVYAERKEDV